MLQDAMLQDAMFQDTLPRCGDPAMKARLSPGCFALIRRVEHPHAIRERIGSAVLPTVTYPWPNAKQESNATRALDDRRHGRIERVASGEIAMVGRKCCAMRLAVIAGRRRLSLRGAALAASPESIILNRWLRIPARELKLASRNDGLRVMDSGPERKLASRNDSREAGARSGRHSRAYLPLSFRGAALAASPESIILNRWLWIPGPRAQARVPQ
jgi:hypothetical protein